VKRISFEAVKPYQRAAKKRDQPVYPDHSRIACRPVGHFKTTLQANTRAKSKASLVGAKKWVILNVGAKGRTG